jgi:hypothetical protein
MRPKAMAQKNKGKKNVLSASTPALSIAKRPLHADWAKSQISELWLKELAKDGFCLPKKNQQARA